MKISEIINLLNKHKHVIILTPNYLEQKLLYDKFKLYIKDATIIDINTIKINNSYITFIIPDNFNSITYSTSFFIIEFPNQISCHLLNKIMYDDVMLVQEIF